MRAFQIPEHDLSRLLDRWRAQATVYGPRKDVAGGVELAPLAQGEQPEQAYRNFVLPPVGLIERGGQPAVLFGVRPCDAAAFEGVAEVERPAVVSLACGPPLATCFCASVGGGASGEAGADVIAHGLGSSVVLVPLSSTGEALLRAAAEVLVELGPEGVGRVLDLVRSGHEPDRAVERPDVEWARGLAPDTASWPLWAELDQLCRGCEVCSRLCPVAGRGSTAGGQWRARLLRLIPSKETGRPACVGCGRCVRHCPVGLDPRASLRAHALSADFIDPP